MRISHLAHRPIKNYDKEYIPCIIGIGIGNPDADEPRSDTQSKATVERNKHHMSYNPDYDPTLLNVELICKAFYTIIKTKIKEAIGDDDDNDDDNDATKS